MSADTFGATCEGFLFGSRDHGGIDAFCSFYFPVVLEMCLLQEILVSRLAPLVLVQITVR